jgi:osmotically inducible protein OsmC
MPAKASAEWHGAIRSGTGEFTAGDTIAGGFTYKSRFEGGPGSNPEQLLGAAHASCFSMALASLLETAGTPAERIHTDAEVTIRLVDGTPTITKIDLKTMGVVPGIDEANFVEQAGVPEVNLVATLDSQ